LILAQIERWRHA